MYFFLILGSGHAYLCVSAAGNTSTAAAGQMVGSVASICRSSLRADQLWTRRSSSDSTPFRSRSLIAVHFHGTQKDIYYQNGETGEMQWTESTDAGGAAPSKDGSESE